MVVEKQPPQMLKTGSMFSATVRVLIAEKSERCRIGPLFLNATIVSEEQARAIVEANDVVNVVDSGDIINNYSTLEHLSTGHRRATFSHMVGKMTDFLFNVNIVVFKNLNIS